MTHKEAIKWLELQSSIPIQWDDYSEKSAQVREEAERRIAEAFRMAINVLKSQEPRVMTLEEVREKKPFVLWVEDIFTGSRVFPIAYIKGIYQDSALDWILDIDAPVEGYNVN